MINGAAELTEIERLRLENYALKFNALQTQLQQVAAERRAYILKVESDHPGYMWDEIRGLVSNDAEPPEKMQNVRD